MATEKTVIPHFGVDGMDRSKQSYLVGPTAWFTQHNVRMTRQGLVQVPRKGPIMALGTVAFTCVIDPIVPPTPPPPELLTNIYAIQGYSDGLFVGSGFPWTDPVWDGTFPAHFTSSDQASSPKGWASGEVETMAMNGGLLCCAIITWRDAESTFGGLVSPFTWFLRILHSGVESYQATKVGGATPEGVYTKVFGEVLDPENVTIYQPVGMSTLMVGDFFICFNA